VPGGGPGGTWERAGVGALLGMWIEWGMPWIMADGGCRYRITDDHNGCEWVNASSRTGSPGQSRTRS